MKIKFLLLTLAASLTATAAVADTVQVQLKDANTNTFSATETSSVDFGFTGPENFRAALFALEDTRVSGTDDTTFLDTARRVDGTGGAGGSASTANIAAFCIDLAETISFNSDTRYTIASDLTDAPVVSSTTTPGDVKMNALRANAVRQLWRNEISTVLTAGIDSVKSSALQIALHEIVFERDSAGYGTWDADTGSYTVSDETAILTEVEAMFGRLDETDDLANLVALVAPTPETGGLAQDLLVELPGTGEVIIPEPGSVVMLFGLGAMLGLGYWRRRRS